MAPRNASGGRRVFVAVVLALLLALGSWWVWQARPTGGAGDAGAYDFSVVGPDGMWWNGTVHVAAGATVLDATRVAADGNFSIDVRGTAMGSYVRGIGPYSETATGGWNYCIDSGNGYAWVGIAADQRHLMAGERIQWRWAENGSEIC